MPGSFVEKICENIYCFPIVLPDNPLKWLNCYVITGGEGDRSLLIDTGFNRPECLEALLRGMDELGLKAENTDIFLSHVHSDHTGNAGILAGMGCRVLISSIDKELMFDARWAERLPLFKSEGMPDNLIDEVLSNNPGMLYAPKNFDAAELQDGDTLYYGGYELRCIHTPGHTPGHMCLYDERVKLLFSGDHILFDISPNICIWRGFHDPVGTYMKSLEDISKLDVDLCLPSHRSRGEISVSERASALIEHHKRRLDETEKLIEGNPGINAYDLAGKMSWRIRARNWEDFPAAQKNFALLETLAHIEYLIAREKVERLVDGAGNKTYAVR